MAQQTLSRWFTVDQVGAVTVVRFAHVSILDDEVVDHIRAELYEMVEHEGRRLVVLNFGQVTGLASRTLGAIVGLHKRLEAVGGRLVLCEVSKFLYEFFDTAHLPGLLCFRGGEPEAVQALTSPPH
jgi:anti-sigma B factor antagonist